MRGFSTRRFSALVTKECVQILRDPSTLLIAFVLPAILLFLFGYGISLDTARTKIGLALESNSAPALGLAQSYQNSPWFEVTTAPSIQPLKDQLIAGQIRAIVVIPEDFGQAEARATPTPIQVITDGSMPNTATFVAAYAEGVRASWSGSTSQSTTLETRYWFNPELKSRYSLIPGSIAIVMTMIGTLLTALVVAREWERGTMEAILATPITTTEFIASKIAPYFLLGLIATALSALLAVTVFGVPFRGSLLALFGISATFLVPALGQGLLISVATKNQFAASQIALLTAFLPAFLLSGFLFEVSSMPVPIQWLTCFVPARYVIPSLKTLFLAGDLWELFLPNMLVMLGFGVVSFAPIFILMRKRLD